MSKLIFVVNTVELDIMKSDPPQLTIIAKGQVNTGGWTDPVLVLKEMIPPDGMYEFDFCATPPDPTSYVPQVMVDVEAKYVMQAITEDLKGVKVVAETNSVSEVI